MLGVQCKEHFGHLRSFEALKALKVVGSDGGVGVHWLASRGVMLAGTVGAC